eukprot:scaffold38976_cov63-Phaeocystis_antarctica.AAC.1
MGTSAAAGSVLPHQRLRQPDSALRALLLACRLELRHARLRASRASGVCEAPTFTERFTMMVSTYTEDSRVFGPLPPGGVPI